MVDVFFVLFMASELEEIYHQIRYYFSEVIIKVG
jgi:hypothetical protein